MKARWCISAIIFILTLFGVVNQHQTTLPNQEIVLQFTDVELTSDAAQHTIAMVKRQLQAIGVGNLRIKEGSNGKIKIAYYSDADVASIQKKLSNEKELALDYTLNQEKKESKFPSKDIQIGYDLDVYEIQKANDVLLDIDGKFVLEPKYTNDRSFNPNFDVSLPVINIKQTGDIAKVAYRVSRNIAIQISDALHIIPEVRAGPKC
ncbi:hypothetical protein GCM10022291_32480 [Postechiella marina]|uniref:Uncharacterized protein n=1 Tax=Postechiella marina TaxID=943941 RepID=A0ABP8CH59_9FLAO